MIKIKLTTAATARAASKSFSQVFLRLMMFTYCTIVTYQTAKFQQGQRFSERNKLLTPSVFFFQTYCSMVVSLLSEPMCVVAANILVTSSSVKARADMPADILGSEAKYTRIFTKLMTST